MLIEELGELGLISIFVIILGPLINLPKISRISKPALNAFLRKL